MPDRAVPDSDSSETNLVIVTQRDRFKLFCKLHWRNLIIFLTPLVLLPIAFVGHNYAYTCFYAFLVTAVYWISDAIHPSVATLFPIAVSSLMGETGFINEMYIRNELVDSLGVMMIIAAVEQCQIYRRVAYKLLLFFGCSHYRLSFLLFFMTMFLSMWISDIIACGLMMPLVKTILVELEKLGILEVYQTIGKAKQKSVKHGESKPRPTDFTVFYFLGIAYSSSIGAMATIIGSQTNQILKYYCETLFPTGPKIEFPHFMLLNLPGVLVMETILYLWMNFYFLGMCRAQSEVLLEIGMTEEEAQYIKTLLAAHYKQMGRITFHESIIAIIVILTALLQPTISAAYIDTQSYGYIHIHFKMSSPCMLCAILVFIIPRDLTFLQFFKKQSEDNREPLPQTPSRVCLSWATARYSVNWSVLFIIGGSATLFESFRYSRMTEEMEKFLLLCSGFPSAALILIVIIFFKVLTEFAPGSSVAFSLLPHVARLGVSCGVNPHYLMMAATLSCSLSFHLITGSPVNAMVAAYVHIPPWKMMAAGLGMSLASIVVAWFTAAAWATAVWSDTYREPHWASNNMINKVFQ